jgi:hypothetical protein
VKRHTAAQVGDTIGKTEHWVKRNAARLPHHRAGQTYYWTDDDIADILAAQRVRPEGEHTPGAPKPFTGRRRTA